MNRIAYKEKNPNAYNALLALEGHVRNSGLESRLLDLLCLRVSQINGCAFCVDMHSKDLRVSGETADRLALLPVWRETDCFTQRERAVLAFAEALTTLGREGVPDEVYAAALTEVGESMLVDLAVAVGTINVWNRLGVAFRSKAGAYQAKAK